MPLDFREGRFMTASRSPEANGPFGAELLAVNRALDQLPEAERQLLLLRHREHRTFEEIGQGLNCLAEEARRRWYHALAHFAAALGSPP
jgi:DNA-directed RNA polymerase specialized sigma24 family protein